jgi:hypothetical protein
LLDVGCDEEPSIEKEIIRTPGPKPFVCGEGRSGCLYHTRLKIIGQELIDQLSDTFTMWVLSNEIGPVF